MQPGRLTDTDVAILQDACAQLRERAAPLAEWLLEVVGQEQAREHADTVRPQFDVTRMSKLGVEMAIAALYGIILDKRLSRAGLDFVNGIKLALIQAVPTFMENQRNGNRLRSD